MADEGVGLTAP